MPQFSRFLLILILFSLLACSNDRQIQEQFSESLAQIQKTYAPDLSLDVFDVHLIKSGSKWIVSGELTSGKALHAIRQLSDSLLKNYENRITSLPDSALGDSIYGIVQLSVAHLRREPRRASELVDQVVLGYPVKLLKSQKSWYLVQTEYRYIGWITKGSLWRTTKEGLQKWQTGPRVRIRSLFALILEQPKDDALPVSDAVLNAAVQLLSKNRYWAKVALPGGTIGYIHTEHISDLPRLNMSSLTGEEIVQTAKTMLGIPYLWGGNSSKASDCSGFTQNVFRFHGILLPRDARQQAKDGVEIIPEKDFSNIKPGDLLFFGSSKNKITHVGISLGGYEYIHQDSQDGKVRINSFDSTAANYKAYRKITLRKIKRLLKN